MPPGFEEQAERFARELDDLIAGCLASPPEFNVVSLRAADARIGPGQLTTDGTHGFPLVDLPRANDVDGASLLLKVEFRVVLDQEQLHLTVVTSAFGLWVRSDASGKPRPVFRIEYERDARGKAAAHVHFHAESADMAWVYGSAGQPLPTMKEIHFPVGGKRFQPTIEDVLLSLAREKL